MAKKIKFIKKAPKINTIIKPKNKSQIINPAPKRIIKVKRED